MAAVKGSKQYQMVVVPHRPVYKALIFMSFLVSLVMFSWLTYQYGISQGMALKVEVVKERDQISAELDEAKVHEALGEEAERLRIAVAESIHRKRVPELSFRYQAPRE